MLQSLEAGQLEVIDQETRLPQVQSSSLQPDTGSKQIHHHDYYSTNSVNLSVNI